MFREMRRNAQQLSSSECIEILQNCTSGVLAVLGDDDYPYAVPLSYAYDSGSIYFHCALTGHKIDAINNNNKVSFCVISQDNIFPAEYTTHYKSVIVFGKASVLTDTEEKKKAIFMIAEKYSPAQTDKKEVISDAFDRFNIIEIKIEHMSGKQAKELIRK